MYALPGTMYADAATQGGAPLPALTSSTLMQLWVAAGGAPSVAVQMAAIALAESSGIPNNVNPTDNGGTQASWGLWQISDGTHEAPNVQWADPYVNAQMAVAKYKTRGFAPWGTYGGTRYLGELAAIESGVPSPSATSSPGPSGNAPASPWDSVTELGTVVHNFGAAINGDFAAVGGAIGGIGAGIQETVASIGTMKNVFENFGPFVVGLGLIVLGSLMLAMMWGEDIVRAMNGTLQSSGGATVPPSNAKSGALEEAAEVAEV